MYPMCVTQSAVRGTVEIRITIGRSQLKHKTWQAYFIVIIIVIIRAHQLLAVRQN